MAMSDPVIGHCDAGPYNVVARDGCPIALVDWELAGPVDRLGDLALCGWLNAQLHEAAFSNAGDLPDVEMRAQQLRALLDGYGLESQQRSGLIGVMIEMIIRSAHDRASRFSVTPHTIMAVSPEGFPFGWDIAWRVGAANWILAHRQVLEAVIL
jgi:aminoglycoside phosphotransferase (APT) family kinase protein